MVRHLHLPQQRFQLDNQASASTPISPSDRKKVMKRMKRAEEELFKLRNLKIEKDEDLELNDSVQPAADAPAEPNSARIQQLEEELARLKDQEIYTKVSL